MMSHWSLTQLAKTILNDHITSVQSIAIAVSGGPDSMAALNLLQSFWTDQHWDASLIHILTCDHNTRENIQKEIDLTESVRHGATMEIFRYGWSDHDESSLRTRRHEQFVNYCQKHHITFLITGHHLDDRIETTLLNMKRGSALKGILAVTQSDPHFLNPDITILRPLIHSPKSEILDYCKEQNIPFALDPTNSDTNYSQRNLIRQFIHDHLSTDNFYKSFTHLYNALESHQSNNSTTKTLNNPIIQQPNNSITIIPQKNHDLITIFSWQRTPDNLYNTYKHYDISINPRSNTLDNLCEQLNKKSGNKISYQWLSICAYTYASTVKIIQ